MTEPTGYTLDSIPAVRRLFRLQWEEVQNAYVLLYPEGMVQLNQSAGEILKRCDGVATVAGIAAELESVFNEADLKGAVISFLEVAHERGWIERR